MESLTIALIRINGTLNINDAFSLPTIDGTANQVLKTDGAGNLSWINYIAGTIQDADNDTKIQVEESADEDMIRFDVGGSEAMLIDSLGNVGIGTDLHRCQISH